MECNQGFLWISFYFSANLLLTIHNKWVMSKTGFDFPWTLTAIHISLSGIGAYLLCQVESSKSEDFEPLLCGTPSKQKKESGSRTYLALFSFLYAINIAVSNLSLSYVSLALHQIMRSSTPIFTVCLDYFVRNKRCSRWELISLLPVVLGIILASFKSSNSSSFSNENYVNYAYGISMTILGVVLSALKGIVTNAMLSGPQSYNPLELIWKTAVLSSAQCLFYGFAAGEFGGICHLYNNNQTPYHLTMQVIVNGTLAFFLNWISFTANAKTSALSMTVAGNVKQALLIILAIYIFSTPITNLNLLGIIITLVGGCWYSFLKYHNSQKLKQSSQ